MLQYDLHPDLKKYGRLRLGNFRMSRPVLALNNMAARVSCAFFRPPKNILLSRIQIPGEQADIPALVFLPRDLDGQSPCLLYFHGGGFISPDFGYLRRILARYAEQAGCTVIYPLYRLAPKHPYPAALDDAVDSCCWLLDHGGEIGVDSGNIAVGGDSAGGCLAAALCHAIRDQGLPMPVFQFLIYPVLDNRLATDSMRELADCPGCNPHLLRQMWAYYLTNDDGGLPEYVAPGAADNLSGLPPAYIETQQFDSLKDEGRLYAERLAEAGTPVHFVENAGAFHAFDVALGSAFVREILDRRGALLRRALRRESVE